MPVFKSEASSIGTELSMATTTSVTDMIGPPRLISLGDLELLHPDRGALDEDHLVRRGLDAGPGAGVLDELCLERADSRELLLGRPDRPVARRAVQLGDCGLGTRVVDAVRRSGIEAEAFQGLLQMAHVLADDPRPRSRYDGSLPSRRNTGLPDTVSATSPSESAVPSSGRPVTIWRPLFSSLGTTVSTWGEPKRAVPRVTMSVESRRSSAGTRIGDAGGALRRAAASAGDWMKWPASQPASAATTTTATTRIAIVRRFIPRWP